MNNKIKWILFILLSAVIFGSYWVFAKIISEHFGVFYHWAIRGLMIVLMILPILLYKKQIIKIKKTDFKWIFIFIIANSLNQAPWFFAFKYLDVWTGSLLLFATMLLTIYVFWFLFLKEKITKIKIFSFIFSILWIILIFPINFNNIVFFAAIMMILSWISSWIWIPSSKKLSGYYHSLYLAFLWWLGVFVINFILAFIFWEPLILPEFNLPWLYLFLYALAGFFAFWFVIEWFKYIEASLWWLVGLFEIIFAIIYWILFFWEVLTLKIFIWWLLILSSVIIPNWIEYFKKIKSS